jgi:hypothetical protein
VLAVLALTGCSVATSTPVFEVGRGFQGCSSRLGSYALPRRVLHVRITSSGDNFTLANLEAEAVPDNAHNYCLEHDSNPFAEDSIRVYKDKIDVKEGTPGVYQIADTDAAEAIRLRTPYLQLIASKAVDHTAGIIRNIIRTVFIGLSNNPAFSGRAGLGEIAGAVTVADHQVDPFNFHEMAELNQDIRRYGFCIVLAGYTFNERTQDASSYCNNPQRQAELHVPPSHKAIQSMRWHVPKPAAGIFYRPRAPYKIEVYTKHRPEDRGDWQLSLMKTEHMENIMPVVSVGIARELFAERRTGLIFNDGELVDVCISKGNSITGTTDIVLDVVYGVINLPSATIQGVINDTNTRNALVAKRKELFDAQQKYIAFLESGQATGVKVKEGENKGLVLNEKTRPQGVTENADGIRDIPESAGAINLEDDPLDEICAKLKVAKTVSFTSGPGGNF